MTDLPTGATAGQIAKILGTSERAVAGRKAAGRLPVLPGGAIDLHAVIRAGAVALAQTRSAGGGADMTAAERFDAGVRAAATMTAHLIVQGMADAGPGADLGIAAAVALAEALDMAGVDVGEVPLPKRIRPMAA
jgi:hypothetical protein